MSRLIIVANRLPIKISQQRGHLTYQTSEGGLATGLNSLKEIKDKIWVGWPGEPIKKSQRVTVKNYMKEKNMHPVFLSKEEVGAYYEGFSNKTIWPLFHYFTEYTKYKKDFWKKYRSVNQKFAKQVLNIAQPGDTIWVHDYQLMLLPGMLRASLPNTSIGFFLHIPFPSYEVFRLLPSRESILKGILGADLIGFHTSGYMRHFMSAVYRILGIEQNLGQLVVNDRIVQVDLFPMGINYNKFSKAAKSPEVLEEANAYRDKFRSQKLILSIDRLDYSKGIIKRLKAFHKLLSNYPEFEGEISLILVVVPSRAGVDKYQELKEEINEMVGYINGRYSGLDWTPIHYLYRALPFNSLVSLYNICDIGLVTPIRDGMNLIAKEFVASKVDKTGVLILSEMAGSASELTDALQINPNDVDEITASIEKAIHMPLQEQKKRMKGMQSKLKKFTVDRWAWSFLDALSIAAKNQSEQEKKYLSKSDLDKMLTKYQEGQKRLLSLDYDGTLLAHTQHPSDAKPDDKLYKLLKQLTEDPKNEIIITSGRDKAFLGQIFGELGLHLIAEHGAWLKNKGDEWRTIKRLTNDWKDAIRPTLQNFTEKTPGAFVEEKEYSLVWHYRNTDAWIADIRVQDLVRNIQPALTKYNLDILEGNKVVEIKNIGVDKGKAINVWLQKENWDFVLAIGDDRTDEATFQALPQTAYTFKVGVNRHTHARFHLKTTQMVRTLLNSLIHNKKASKKIKSK